MALEDDAEEVVGLALMPVVGGVDRGDRWDPGVAVGAGHLDADAAVVGDREEGVDRVELATRVSGVVHTVDAHAHLEAESRLVAQHRREGKQVLAAYEERDLASVDDHLLDRGGHGHAPIGQGELDLVGRGVEPLAIRALRRPRHDDRRHEATETGGVAAILRGEGAVADADDLELANALGERRRARGHLEASLAR